MSNINTMASRENGGILKTEKQLLIEAEQKVGELENKIRSQDELIEKLKWQTASLRIGITAMGNHFNCSPAQAKELFDAYVKAQEEILKGQAEEAKQKFADDLKAGKVPDLRVVDGGLTKE